MSRQAFLLAVIALVAAGGGYFVARSLNPEAAPAQPLPATSARPMPADLVGQRRPDFALSDSQGLSVSAADFDGQAMLVNFWASWCKPCVEELPMLAEMQAQQQGQGLRVVGIALDDPERARAFVAEMDLDYTLLYGEVEPLLTARRYGNDSGMLPYTVLVDRAGIVRWTHLGALVRAELEAKLQELR